MAKKPTTKTKKTEIKRDEATNIAIADSIAKSCDMPLTEELLKDVAEDNVDIDREYVERQRSAPAEKIINQGSMASIPSEIPAREMTVTEHKPIAVKNRYRFFSTVSRLNISNVIFDNVRVVIYETTALSQEDAIFEFKTRIQDRFNGNVEDYNRFINAVFGSIDNIILETISVNNVTEEKINL